MARARWIAIATVAAAFGVAAVAVASAYRRDLAEATAATVGRSEVIDSPFGAIEYADVGEGPAVLVIHGSGGGFDQGLAFVNDLAGKGFRLVAPSRFGYLRSTMPAEATPEMQADALAFLMDRLELDDAVIFGGSAGALSAAQLAIRHPDRCRGLVLGVPALYAPERAPNENAAPHPIVWSLVSSMLGSDLLFWTAIKTAPDFMIRMVLATDPALVDSASEEERRRVRDVLFHILPVSARRDGLLMDGSTAGTPPPYPLERIECPALLFSTRDDLYGTGAAAEWTAEMLPGAKLILYDRGGHLWVGHEHETWSAVADFIRSLE